CHVPCGRYRKPKACPSVAVSGGRQRGVDGPQRRRELRWNNHRYLGRHRCNSEYEWRSIPMRGQKPFGFCRLRSWATERDLFLPEHHSSTPKSDCKRWNASNIYHHGRWFRPTRLSLAAEAGCAKYMVESSERRDLSRGNHGVANCS